MDKPIEAYDDYRTAAKYAVETALKHGDGVLLRCIKTLMEAESSDVLAFLERDDIHVRTIWVYDGTGWNIQVRQQAGHFEGVAKNVVGAAKAAILAEQTYLTTEAEEGE